MPASRKFDGPPVPEMVASAWSATRRWMPGTQARAGDACGHEVLAAVLVCTAWSAVFGLYRSVQVAHRRP